MPSGRAGSPFGSVSSHALPASWQTRASIEIENIPSENPRTGRLSYLSAIAMLRDLGATLRVGT